MLRPIFSNVYNRDRAMTLHLLLSSKRVLRRGAKKRGRAAKYY